MAMIRIVEAEVHGERLLALFAANDEDGTHPRAVLADGGAQLWFAEEDGRTAGALLGREQRSSDGALRGFVDNLIVDTPYRRRGVGRQLMEHAEAYYRARGLFGMQTGGDAGNAIARALYESMGYRVVLHYSRTRVNAADGVVTTARVRMWKQFDTVPR